MGLASNKTQTRLTKTTLVEEIADREDISKAQAKRVLDAMLDVITEALSREEKVTITGFGTFDISHIKARWGVNPQTRERMWIPATVRPTFRAGATLKRAVK